MRTHLLRPVYPSPAVAEPDTGIACNDACYEPAANAATSMSGAQPAQTLKTSNARAEIYELEGYAGI